MKCPLLLLPFAMLATSCTTGIHPVWTVGSGGPPDSLPPPAGFLVTPSQAERIARSTRRMPAKTVYHIYAGNSTYHVCDGFFGSSPGAAVRRGVEIDGRSGAVPGGR
jgi:hypothetical protein